MFDERLFNGTLYGNVQIGNYLQSMKYFKNIVPKLKKLFMFKPKISNKAEEILRKLSTDFLKKQRRVGTTTQNITFVGVHVRRGDLVN